MGVLKDFRRAADALERLAANLPAANRERNEVALLVEKIVDLERSRALWEADVEGMLAKAEGKLRAAANAEARERTMKEFHEEELDPFPQDSPEVEARIQDNDAEAGFAEQVLPLPMGLEAESKKAFRLRMKYQ